jgi:hypothetical protein
MMMLPVPPDSDATALVDRAFHEIAHNFARALGEFEAAADARLADVEARHAAALTRESRICTALQERLFELENALRTAEERRAADAGAFADQVAKRHAEFTASLTQTLQARDALAIELAAVTAALDDSQQARRAEAAAAAEQLRRREAALGAQLAEAGLARATLERAVADLEAARRDARTRAEMDLAAAYERQAALEELVTQETERRTTLEQRFAAAEAALEAADRRHTTDVARAEARLADVQARYDAAVEEHTLDRGALERQLIEAVVAHRQAGDRADAALAAAAAREAELAGRLAQESDARAALECTLAATRTEASRRGHRLLQLVSAHRRRARGQRAAYETQIAAVGAELQRERDENIALRDALRATQDQLHQLQQTTDHERQAHEQDRLTSASELQRVSEEYAQLRDSFDRLQAAFGTLEGIAGEHAAERARLETVVAARDSELNAQAQRHRAAEQAAQDAFAQTEERLRQTLAASAADVARLQREGDALRSELAATRKRADVLRGEAERVPDLQAQLETSQKERRREFERALYGLCRCTPDGVITDANHAFIAMIGRRRVDDVRNTEFAAAVLDCAGDLGWLLEQARSVRRTEPVETPWKTRDGRDLVVRLQASANAAGSVDVAVEDITRVRALEERLRQAHRIEAVGRLASEVASTCDALLRDVARGVQEWMAASESADARRHGEPLLSDITRTASYLRQLGVYGGQQVRAVAPVSVQRVLADLSPVLKRVVGDQITLVLSKSTSSFDVDVEAERLERVLVNVASYARQRMRAGGQMRIDLAATALGRRFVSRHPHVRPGHHVLITVTELPQPGELRDTVPGESRSLDRPGLELGGLVDLVGTCGGHLWLEAQPAGNLVVKIHLPRRGVVDTADPGDPAPSERRGRLARWFRAAPVRLRA